ncbi:uncharacterized protein EKO05_0003644 [Ascochyta rabiei]|nr:uncharacterized protein EKO05_0003644 [Ascochyta rabiei]UPX13118.1 hypothetical protein EKO05_0003644 [Ascochyta rabiei]
MAQSLASMASAQDMVPLYPANGNPSYHRTMQSQQYPQLEYKSRYPQLIETKPTYNSEWSVAYGEDTSPVESYSLDQSLTYPLAPTAAAASNLDGSPYRWTHPTSRSMQSQANYYSDYGHSCIIGGLSYPQSNFQPPAPAEPTSPLNMSSLQLTLPERPRQRQSQPTEIPLAPRRRLPAPQPRPSHGLHHALDQQQDQRLRSSQTVATPSFNNVTPSLMSPPSFNRSLLPWTTANENLMNVVNETTTTATAPTTALAPADTADTSSSFVCTPSADITATSTGSAPPTELNFSTSLLLDPSTMSAPTPPAYSNFRESRDPSKPSTTQLPCNNSTTNLYTYDGGTRRPSFPDNESSSNLVSGHPYTPLNQTTNVPAMENMMSKSFERRNLLSKLASSS